MKHNNIKIYKRILILKLIPIHKNGQYKKNKLFSIYL